VIDDVIDRSARRPQTDRRVASAPAMRLDDATIGYAPYSPDLGVPGDRRRFCFYAGARGLPFGLIDGGGAPPDVAVLAGTADITRWARADRSVKVVYDLVDSYLALPRWGVKNLGRGLAKRLSGEISRPVLDYHRALEAMCARADAVICSTEEQRQAILAHCDNVHVILDHHGAEVRGHKESFEAHRPFRIVWEGLPYTLPAFRDIAGALRRVAGRHDLEVHLVTDLAFHRYAGRFGRRRTEDLATRLVPNPHLHEWRIDTLAEIVTGCDLAVIPALLDDPMFAGKPENRLLLLWRMGLPVIASATPAYRRAMAAAGVDMACADEAAWEEMLERYIADAQGRELAAVRGRAFVTSAHSEQRLVEQWDAVFASLGLDPGR
jgi:glycosyltransferase involved in cell wall biosynthesis